MELKEHRKVALQSNRNPRRLPTQKKIAYTKKRKTKWYLLLERKILMLMKTRVNNEAGEVNRDHTVNGL